MDPQGRCCMPLFKLKTLTEWFKHGEPSTADLGCLPLDNPHVRMLVYLGELRAKADNSSWAGTPIVVGNRIVEERERRLAAMQAAKPKMRMLQGGKRD